MWKGILERWWNRKHQKSASPPRQHLHWNNLSAVTILKLWSLLKAYNFQGKTWKVQAYLRDIELCLYYTVVFKSAIALCLEKCIHFNLKKNTLLLKYANHHLSLQWVVILFKVFCCHFNHLHSFFTRCRFCLRNNFLCQFVRTDFLSISLFWDCNNSVISSGSIRHWSLEPLKVISED